MCLHCLHDNRKYVHYFRSMSSLRENDHDKLNKFDILVLKQIKLSGLNSYSLYFPFVKVWFCKNLSFRGSVIMRIFIKTICSCVA